MTNPLQEALSGQSTKLAAEIKSEAHAQCAAENLNTALQAVDPGVSVDSLLVVTGTSVGNELAFYAHAAQVAAQGLIAGVAPEQRAAVLHLVRLMERPDNAIQELEETKVLKGNALRFEDGKLTINIDGEVNDDTIRLIKEVSLINHGDVREIEFAAGRRGELKFSLPAVAETFPALEHLHISGYGSISGEFDAEGFRHLSSFTAEAKGGELALPDSLHFRDSQTLAHVELIGCSDIAAVQFAPLRSALDTAGFQDNVFKVSSCDSLASLHAGANVQRLEVEGCPALTSYSNVYIVDSNKLRVLRLVNNGFRRMLDLTAWKLNDNLASLTIQEPHVDTFRGFDQLPTCLTLLTLGGTDEFESPLRDVIDLKRFSNLDSAIISHARVPRVLLGRHDHLTTLSLEHTLVEDLNLSQARDLEDLLLGHTHIRSLDSITSFHELTQLRETTLPRALFTSADAYVGIYETLYGSDAGIPAECVTEFVGDPPEPDQITGDVAVINRYATLLRDKGAAGVPHLAAVARQEP